MRAVQQALSLPEKDGKEKRFCVESLGSTPKAQTSKSTTVRERKAGGTGALEPASKRRTRAGRLSPGRRVRDSEISCLPLYSVNIWVYTVRHQDTLG